MFDDIHYLSHKLILTTTLEMVIQYTLFYKKHHFLQQNNTKPTKKTHQNNKTIKNKLLSYYWTNTPRIGLYAAY